MTENQFVFWLPFPQVVEQVQVLSSPRSKSMDLGKRGTARPGVSDVYNTYVGGVDFSD